MLTNDELGRVRVVLVGARNPQNIGAAARAMQDFGFSDLRLVNEYRVPLEDARSAVGAAGLLAGAVESASVAEAVADCQLVVGTTAVGERGIEHRLLGLVEGAEIFRSYISESRCGAPTFVAGRDGTPGSVAILFGSEKTGLTTEQLSHCDWLMTIPLHQPEGARHLSMNLGQAVAVCLWELVRGMRAVEPQKEDPAAKAEDRERMTQMLCEVMQATEYNRRFPASCDESSVRRFVQRIGLNAKDAKAWMGILRQVMWKVKR